MCFIHVSLNALGLKEKGHKATIIVEEEQKPLYLKAKKKNYSAVFVKHAQLS